MTSDCKSPRPKYSDALFQLKSVKYLMVTCKGFHYGFPLDVPREMLQSMNCLEEFKAENICISAPHPDTFQYNPHLKSLTIIQTDSSYLVPELFWPIRNLQALDLSDTQLKSLDFLVQANLSALRYLKLSDDEITVINETLLHSLPALTHLDLEDNPLTCDCSNAGVKQWVTSNSQTQVANGHQFFSHG